MKGLYLILLISFYWLPQNAFANDISNHPLVSEWLETIDFPFELYDIENQKITLPSPRTPKIKSLIITNSKYTNFNELKSVRADRQKTKELFKTHNFEVSEIPEFTDVTSFFKELRKGPALFRRKKGFKEEIDEGDIVVIYYSGHGFMHGTETYLVPTQMSKEIYEDRLSHHAVPLNMILEEVYEEYPSYVFVIFDACRTIPSFLVDRDNNSVPLKGTFAGYKERISWNQRFPNTYIAFAAESSYPAEASASYVVPSPYTSIFHKEFDPKKTVNRIVTEVNGTLASLYNRRAEGVNKSGTYTPLYLPDDKKSKKERGDLWLTSLLSGLEHLSHGDIGEANKAMDFYLNRYSTHEYASQAQFIRDANLFKHSTNFTGYKPYTIAQAVNFSDAVKSLDRRHGPISSQQAISAVVPARSKLSSPRINYANLFCTVEYKLDTFIREDAINDFSNDQDDLDIAIEEINQALNGYGKPSNYIGAGTPVNLGNPENILLLMNMNLSPNSRNQKELAQLNRFKNLSKLLKNYNFLIAGNIHPVNHWETSSINYLNNPIEITLCVLRQSDEDKIRIGGIQTPANTIEQVKVSQEKAELPPQFSRKIFSFANAASSYGYEIEY